MYLFLLPSILSRAHLRYARPFKLIFGVSFCHNVCAAIYSTSRALLLYTTSANDFQQLPVDLDALLAEDLPRALGDGLEAACGEGEDRGTSAREADAQQPGVC